ncbi:class A beta-lactamase [Kitasatospora sp. NPDC059673]|uniref:class A beta-lactamase n=1 Tax=Kitasatospora sp. NPDC059673 TaxID=3346901 RepID=UPI0036A05870
MHPRIARRHLLTAATAAALATVLPTAGRAAGRAAGRVAGRAVGRAPGKAAGKSLAAEDELTARLRALESEHRARLGVFGYDTGSGAAVRYRAGELFPMCSTFKPLAVGAVLRGGYDLGLRVRYTRDDVTAAGYAPVTGRPENLAGGLTIAELCAAAIEFSDNAAANLLLRLLGGPTAVTRFCRTLGDRVTRLDRWEPALNSAEPGRTTDTSSPHALARSYARLTLGYALDPADRRLLTNWLLANTTGANRLRAGLPSAWTLADKTGTGPYGTANDIGLARPPGRAPIVLAVLTTKAAPKAHTHANANAPDRSPAPDRNAAPDEPLIAETAALLAAALT